MVCKWSILQTLCITVLQRLTLPRSHVAPIILLDQAIGNSSVPQAYLAVTPDGIIGMRMHMVHRPSRFVAVMDGTLIPWDNQLFTYMGDVLSGMISIVILPDEPFMVRAPMTICMAQHISELLTADEGVHFFPPLAVDAEQTQVVTCCMMYPPAKYETLFLDSRGYHTWSLEHLVPTLQQDQNMENCRVLVEQLDVSKKYVPVNSEDHWMKKNTWLAINKGGHMTFMLRHAKWEVTS